MRVCVYVCVYIPSYSLENRANYIIKYMNQWKDICIKCIRFRTIGRLDYEDWEWK